MSDSEPRPVAWAFYRKDGSIRFIVDDEARMKAWRSAHDGPIIPLVPARERPEDGQS